MNNKICKLATATIFSTLFFFCGSRAITQPSDVSRILNAPVDVNSSFGPCGWMGDGEEGREYVQLEPSFNDSSRPGDNDNKTIKISYKPGPKNWAGVYWLYPASTDVCNWGQKPGTRINGATKIVFWIKGDRGDEKIEIKAGDVRSKFYKDTFDVSLGEMALTNNWQRKEINLSGANLEQVIGAFAWVAANPGTSGITFYLDGITYE